MSHLQQNEKKNLTPTISSRKNLLVSSSFASASAARLNEAHGQSICLVLLTTDGEDLGDLWWLVLENS